jgi:hypothetical protein
MSALLGMITVWEALRFLLWVAIILVPPFLVGLSGFDHGINRKDTPKGELFFWLGIVFQFWLISAFYSGAIK